MSGPGDNSGEFHAVIADRIGRLEKENRLLRDALGRLLGRPPGDVPEDEVAAARKRKGRSGRRNAGFAALLP